MKTKEIKLGIFFENIIFMKNKNQLKMINNLHLSKR